MVPPHPAFDLSGLLPEPLAQDAKILVVDDQDMIRLALLRMLRKALYTCSEASSVDEALAMLETDHFDLVLCDIEMPGKNGLELVRALAPRMPETAVLMVSSMDDVEIAAQCFQEGAYGYVVKPVNSHSILINVASALRRRMLEIEFRAREHWLDAKVREQTEEIRASRSEIAFRLISASEHRDNETGAHIRRIGLYSGHMVRLLGWDEARTELILAAAPMHDIGKIGVPDRILQKGGPLTDEEWILMKTHTAMGANMLKGSTVPFIQMGARIAVGHHEKWNGLGYPAGLAGTQIPLEARVVALVDVFDALSNRRCYKPAWPEEKVVELIRSERGAHFDPDLAQLFLDHFDEFRRILAEHPDASEFHEEYP
jgi:putative two-component system response regulator